MLKKIAETINTGKTFLVTSHVRPDGDSIGSMLALYHMLKGMGKSVTIYNQDETPSNYVFLPGSEQITHVFASPENYDAVFILDCSELERIGKEAGKIGSINHMINIDHHISNRKFCDLVFIDGHASSTSELIFRLAETMGLKLTKGMADNLYAGIMTDTGGFRYGSTSQESLIAAARMVASGADPQWLSENIYENNPVAKIKLIGVVLKTLALDFDGKLASLVVSKQSLAEAGALMEHTEGFVDIPRTIGSVVAAVLFSELDDRHFKVSMRSKGKFNVARIAESFGGGGHVNAAACRCEGDIGSVKQAILKAFAGNF